MIPRLVWEHSPAQFAGDIGDWFEKAMQVGVLVAADLAEELASIMKADAPWTDRTGNARQGLSGDAERVGTSIVLTLFHVMDYGIWLEVAHAGNYAVIMPTIQANAARVIEEITYAVTGA